MHCSSYVIHFPALFPTDAQAVLWTWNGCFLLWSKARQTERDKRNVRNLLVVAQAFHNLLSFLGAHKCFSGVTGGDLSETFYLFCSVHCSESFFFFSEQTWLEEKQKVLMAASDHVERLQLEKEKLSEHTWVWQRSRTKPEEFRFWGGQQSMRRVTNVEWGKIMHFCKNEWMWIYLN